MNARVIPLKDPTCPEHLSPSLTMPVGGPIPDARLDIERLMDDMKTGMRWAFSKHLAVLTMAVDRNGAYLVIAPHKHLRTLFGEECALWRREVSHGMATEHWLGMIGHIRFFWREVTECN